MLWLMMLTFRQRDRSAAVLMCAIGIYEAISKALSVEVTARKILPKLIPLSLEVRLFL